MANRNHIFNGYNYLHSDFYNSEFCSWVVKELLKNRGFRGLSVRDSYARHRPSTIFTTRQNLGYLHRNSDPRGSRRSRQQQLCPSFNLNSVNSLRRRRQKLTQELHQRNQHRGFRARVNSGAHSFFIIRGRPWLQMVFHNRISFSANRRKYVNSCLKELNYIRKDK